MTKLKLHIGCGNNKINEFINIDIRPEANPDVIGDAAALPYGDNSVDLIYSCCMLEHFGKNNNLKFFRNTSWVDVLKHWYDILKPGGELYVSTIDFRAICDEYLENNNLESLIGATLGGQKNEEDLHGMLFDFDLVSRQLSSLGYDNIERYNWRFLIKNLDFLI